MYKTPLKSFMKHGFIYELSTEVNELSTQVRALPTAHDRPTPAHERRGQLPVRATVVTAPGAPAVPRPAGLERRDGRSP
jgi:hypothetical protein